MSRNDVESSVERGLAFLERSQLPSGEFKVFMARDEGLEKECVVDSTPFPTALIVYSLGFADPGRAGAMIGKALQFFLREMEGPGLWRYWTREHKYHSVIPPDLDDVACVSYVLRRHGVAFPENLKLIFSNRNAEGLFYTWLTPRWPPPPDARYLSVALRQLLRPISLYYFWKLNESAPHDVDCVVNANVLFYVGDGPATRPVVDYLTGVLRRGEEGCCDKWHLNRFMFHYAVARNFDAGVAALESARDGCVGRIVAAARDDGAIGGNAFDTALAVCALLCWKSSPPELGRAVEFLLRAQGAAGDWPRVAAYYGGPKKFYGWGSEELTTGFCLEALLRYNSTHSPASRA